MYIHVRIGPGESLSFLHSLTIAVLGPEVDRSLPVAWQKHLRVTGPFAGTPTVKVDVLCKLAQWAKGT